MTVRPFASVTRARTGLVVHAALAAAAIALLAQQPLPSLDHPELLAALLCVAVVCELAETWLASGIRLNATIAVAVMALAIGGPLAAFAVLLVPDLAVWAMRRDERLLRAGTLANLAAYGWAALAGAGVLALADVHGPELQSLPAVVTAGLAVAVANFAVGPALYAPLQLGVPAHRMPGELAGALPAVLVMVLAGTLTAALIPALGVAALGIFAFVTLVPAGALTAAIRPRPVSLLNSGAATALFAAALADVLRLDRRDRRILARAAAVCAHNPDPYERLWLTIPASGDSSDPHAFEAARVAAHAAEHYDGAGGPAGLHTDLIPPLSRVLAVATGWACLTCADTAELSHQEALLDLEARSGAAYDPAIVAAAGTVVERDTRFAHLPAAQPRLHAWPGSADLRHRLAPRVFALAAAE